LDTIPGFIVVSKPVVADGTVYVGSYDANVYSFGLGGSAAARVLRPAAADLHPNRSLVRR
jgi:hypothetical protein